MAVRGSAGTAPGAGPPLELLKLPGGAELWVPTVALRALSPKTNELEDIQSDGNGALATTSAVAEHAATFFPPRALQYARDASDQMRVAASGTVGIGGMQLWNFNQYSGWYASTGSPNSMDARETQREMSAHTFQTQRQRWAIT